MEHIITTLPFLSPNYHCQSNKGVFTQKNTIVKTQ